MLSALLIAFCVAARADSVYLKNGNKMDGLVVSDDGVQVTLDIGYGSTVLKKSDIERIDRSPKEAVSAEESELKRRRFESGLVVPPGAEKLDALYRQAQSRREKALDARVRQREITEESAGMLAEPPDLKNSYQALSKDLPRYDAAADPRGYNGQIGRINAVGTKIQADAMRIQEIDREKKEFAGDVGAYLDATRELEEYLAGPGAGLLKQQADYFAFLKSELKTMANDFRQETVVAEKKGGAVFVDALINGKVRARLMVDTGASSTVLYKEASDRLALDQAADLGVSHTKLADGRTVDAQMVRLESVAVGKSSVAGSTASIVPVAGMGFDGLLGMSFLGRFITRVDAANGRLTLEDLKP